MEKFPNAYVTFLYYWTKLWALAPFTLTNTRAHARTSFEVIYAFLFFVLFCIPQGYSLIVSSIVNDSDATTMTRLSNDFAHHIGNLGGGLCPIVFVLKRRNIVKILNSLFEIDGMLSTLGVEQNYEGNFKLRAVGVVGLFTIVLLLILIWVLIWCLEMNVAMTIWDHYSMTAGNLVYIELHHVFLLFVNVMDFVHKRYQQLSERLMNICEYERKSNHVRDRRVGSKNWKTMNSISVVQELRSNASPVLRDNMEPLERLRKIGKLYDNIREVTDSIVDLFSLPIVAIIAFYTLMVLNICYSSYVGVQGTSHLDIANYVNQIAWAFVMFAELLAIAVICSSTQTTVHSIAVTLHRLWMNCYPADLKDEVY